MGNCCAQNPSDAERLVDEPTLSSSAGNSGKGQGNPVASDELPAGWRAVPSRSRPGKIAYQNIFTGERISWVPTEPASHTKGEIKKKKKKKKKKKRSDSAPKGGDAGEDDGLLKGGEATVEGKGTEATVADVNVDVAADE